MLAERAIRAHVTEAVVLERIAELWRFRAWYRRQVHQDYWLDLAIRNDQELRALVRLVRKARRDVGWTEPELREAHGGR